MIKNKNKEKYKGIGRDNDKGIDKCRDKEER